jgi:starch synthase
VKTGGLGDVTGSLPSALHILGADTFLILPLYRTIMAKNLPLEQVMNGTLTMGGRAMPYSVLRHQQTYFIAQNEFFERDGLYNTREGDYPDNWLRFAFFARAALETIIALGGSDVIHVHDWQAALLPVYLRVLYP